VWLEKFLQQQDRTVVLTSHDQIFLDNVVEETIIIRNSALEYFEGTPHAMEVAERKERLGKEKQQRALDKKKSHVSNADAR
jgi:ATP-binding cassette subfamily F protein 3